jgi:outer membrane protein TolC
MTRVRRNLSAIAFGAIAFVAMAFAAAPSVRAQGVPNATPDSLTLRSLRAEALRIDARMRQLSLQSRMSDLRLRNIAAEKRPTLAIDGLAQYQSAVTEIPVSLPNVSIPTPPNDTYDAHLGIQQSLYDPSKSARRKLERAQLAEAQAQTRTSLFSLRQEVDDAFYTAAAISERLAEIEGAIADLTSRLRETAVKLHEGAALPGDTAAVAASLLQGRQDRLQLAGDRTAALARLSELVGRPIDERASLVLANDSTTVAETQRALDSLRSRPEFAQFEASRDRLASEVAVEASREKPRVSAFGRLGYGRPGLDMLSRDFQLYWIGGVQVHWAPWTWGTTARDREIIELQREIVTTNEDAFRRSLRRSVEQSIATIARLNSTLALDDQIVRLRERIDAETRAKLTEGAVTAAEYVDKSTDLLTARLVRIQHRVQLAQARTNFLTTLGVEVP